MKQWELTPEQLKSACNCAAFPFETTAEVPPLEGIVGQERAVKAMEFGLKIRKHGYNIFISGFTGTGRNSYTQSLVKEVAMQEEIPWDWCYVYNFEKPDQPKALTLPPGLGVKFQNDMTQLVNQVKLNIPKALASEEYGKRKTMLYQSLQDRQAEIWNSLDEAAKKLGFALKNTEKGILTIPLNAEGKQMDEEEYKQLSREAIKEIEEKSKAINFLVLDAFKKIRDLEKEIHEQVERLESQLVIAAIGHLFENLKEEYSDFPPVGDFLEEVKKDILKNLKEFKGKEEKSPLEMFVIKDERAKDFTFKYMVNVLVDNSKTRGAPVIVESNPTFYNLIGRVEYETQLGVLTTDFTKIKAGALHRANGGYLILQCSDVLTNILTWNALKRALKTEKITIENIAEHIGTIATSSLKPEPIPLDVKIILIGSYLEHQILYNYDEDYRKLFKIRADFDVEMERTQSHMFKLAQFISDHCQKEKLRHFTKMAVARIVEYSSRLADSQEKLSTRFNELVEIIYEADTWAELAGADLVTEEYVVKAIKEKIFRANKYERKLQEMIEKGVILIDTQEKVVGQVNGLAVLDLGEYSFGKPSRITVNTYMGQRGIINIEREAKMSGRIHDKGVLILSGYLGEKFGRKCPLSFSASICFEQLYDGVDGDSASSTELYGLLSSLSGIPIKQYIAVTGSVNQKGQVQPIGGVNQKIEGFFQVCKAKGLNGKQGVMIPYQNVANLMLDDEVIEAVKDGKFHIYAVKAIEEGIEILTGVPAGTPDAEGNYPEGTVFYKVQKRLEEIYRCLKKEDKKEGNIISEVDAVE
ncbi:MAG: Lon protease family protein [Bacillota bacterium]